MIIGNFDRGGKPTVTGSVTFPVLHRERAPVVFVLDTGADVTCIHDEDAGRLEIPFDQLRNIDGSARGVGGKQEYYLEPAHLTFVDDNIVRAYDIQLRIAKPTEDLEDTGEEEGDPERQTIGLPSLLGRDILNNWFIVYDPQSSRINCSVRYADTSRIRS